MRITNNHNLPRPLYEAIVKDEGEIKESETLLRVTSHIDTPKRTILKIRHNDEIVTDASDMLWAFLGKMGHRVCEGISHYNRLVEERLSEEVGGVTITGRPDLMGGIIDDYKFTSVWSYLYNKKGKKEWIGQLNDYAWLLRKKGFDDLIRGLRVNLILRDWVQSKAKRDKDYPRIPFVLIKLPLWNFDIQESFVGSKVERFKYYFQFPDDEIPVCTEEERWAKPATYALMKKGRKSAVKVFGDEGKAREGLKGYIGSKDTYYIEPRPGEDTRCKSYCLVMPFCNYGKQYIGKG